MKHCTGQRRPVAIASSFTNHWNPHQVPSRLFRRNSRDRIRANFDAWVERYAPVGQSAIFHSRWCFQMGLVAVTVKRTEYVSVSGQRKYSRNCSEYFQAASSLPSEI